MSDLYHVSSSPHVRSKDTTERIMLYVIIASASDNLYLVLYNFGYRAADFNFSNNRILCCIRVDFQSDRT